MSPERQLSADALFRFEHWKARFRKVCETYEKLPAFNSLGDSLLKLLWESGTEPSVRATPRIITSPPGLIQGVLAVATTIT